MRWTSLTLVVITATTCPACGPGTNDADTTGDASTSAADTSGESTSATTGGPGMSSDDAGMGTDTGSLTTGATGTTGATAGTDETGDSGSSGDASVGTTGPGDGCEALQSEAQCKQDPDCMVVVGRPLAFAGCTPGATFLACMPTMGCDDAITTICEDAPGMGIYKIANGCVPPGFSICASDLVQRGESLCESLGEAKCADAGCTPITGAPHMQQGDEMCVDFAVQEFLGCLEGGVACRPVITSVCPQKQPDSIFDVPSSCIPPGFKPCNIASIRQVERDGQLVEEISFTYQKIEWLWVDGGITAMDDWEAPIVKK